MKAIGFFLFCWTLVSALPLHAQEPQVLAWNPGVSAETVQKPEWLAGVRIKGGSPSEGAWKVSANETPGLGELVLSLDASAELDALALTLTFTDLEGADLMINVRDTQGRLLGVDLFGNLMEAARDGQTDTFIVPLSLYPGAGEISIRRINGPVEISGVVAFPVVEALGEISPEEKARIARLLNERLPVGGATGSAGIQTAGGRPRPAGAADALAEPGYPMPAWNGPLKSSEAFPIYCSGTCYRFLTNLILQLFPGDDDLDQVSFVSSHTALNGVLDGDVQVALVSYPSTAEQRADFLSKNGFPLVEIPVGLDAVEVLVHPKNRLESVSPEILRKIFAVDGGGSGYWDPESGLRGPIITVGGWPSWGTSRFFSERMLGGADFLPSMVKLDVAFARGVEAFVSQNSHAIGFAQHQPGNRAVRALPIRTTSGPVSANAASVNDGTYPLSRALYLVISTPSLEALPAPVRRLADLILSHEGQSAVAAAGSFPLSADAAGHSRQALGLK